MKAKSNNLLVQILSPFRTYDLDAQKCILNIMINQRGEGVNTVEDYGDAESGPMLRGEYREPGGFAQSRDAYFAEHEQIESELYYHYSVNSQSPWIDHIENFRGTVGKEQYRKLYSSWRAYVSGHTIEERQVVVECDQPGSKVNVLEVRG